MLTPALPCAPIHPAKPVRTVCMTLSLLVMAGCVSTPTARLLRDGQQVIVEGRVSRIDRSPMAYDGDGLLVLDTSAHGEITVHLAARRNLCLARGLDLFNTATVGMHLQASGTATGPSDLSVCRDSTHYLQAAP